MNALEIAQGVKYLSCPLKEQCSCSLDLEEPCCHLPSIQAQECCSVSESDGAAEPGGLEQGQEQSCELPIGKRGQDLKGGLYKREFKVIDIP